MTRTVWSLLGLSFGLLCLLGSGCTSVYVAWMLPRADGASEFVLFTKSRSPGLRKSGGEFFIEEDYKPDLRVLWKDDGMPPRIVGKSTDSVAPMVGLAPRHWPPVAQCGQVGSVPAASATQREGESLVWCLWTDPAQQPVRIEARLPFEQAAQFRQELSEEALSVSIEPLPGQRAVMSRGGKLFLLDARSQTTQPVLGERAVLHGATAEGDLVVRTEDGRILLLLRSHNVLPMPHGVHRLAVAAGALWATNHHDKRLLRIDPETAASAEVQAPPGCVELLGSDVQGNLWFSAEPSIVRRGEPVTLCRWNPQSLTPKAVQLPTEQ